MKKIIPFTFLFFAWACNNSTANDGGKDSTNTSATVDAKRPNPSSNPVAQYEQKVPNDLNNWVLSAKMYETEDRFRYKLALKYEEVSGDSFIDIPNLGTEPKPVIKKGANDMECIIGFNDNHGVFHEYKKIHIVDGNLKVTTLHSYSVTTK